MPHLDNIQKKGYVLEFGHLSRDKGTDTLLEVAKKMSNTEFVFIGYGPSADKMKDIPNVKYKRDKLGEELYRIIAEAAISVCPSEWLLKTARTLLWSRYFWVRLLLNIKWEVSQN